MKHEHIKKSIPIKKLGTKLEAFISTRTENYKRNERLSSRLALMLQLL